MPLLLRLSEEPQADCGGRVTPLALRDAAILLWLALEGPTPRERLAALMWPDSSPMQSRTALRQRLFQLKHQTGRELVQGQPVLRLADGVVHDLAEGSELLGGLSLSDAPEFDSWLQAQREQRRQRELEALRSQADAMEANGMHEGALAVAQSVLRMEPLSEAAHRRVVRLHYLRGDRAAALAAFDACERVLKDEVSARPSAETLALLATVEQAGPPTLSAPRVLPAAVLRPPRLVGRERELAALQSAWAARRVAALVGEAGLGKSRLLAEFCEARGGVVIAQARPSDAEVPYATLARLLRALAARHPPSALKAQDRVELARLLPEQAPAGGPPPQGQPPRLQRSVARYMASAPGLEGLVLDDLHHADSASLDMLQALLAEPDAPRWALAFRPAEAGSRLRVLHDALVDAARLEAVTLSPLDEARLAELVDQLQLGVQGHCIAPALHRRTGGNPLFALETLKQAWVEGDILRLQGDASHLPRTLTVERLIDRRVAQLSLAALALARVAAVAGVDFNLDLAETVLGTPAMLLADALQELERAQVFKGLQFAHDLVFEAARRSVPDALAMHVHGKVAAWLEDQGGEPARVAQHWMQAGRPERARVGWGRAALAAESALRLREAFEFHDRKARIEEQIGDRKAAFETRHMMVMSLANRVLEGEAALAECDHLAALAATDAQHVRAGLARALTCRMQFRFGEAEVWARRACEKADTLGDPVLRRSCELELFSTLSRHDRTDEALAVAERCLGWIDEHPDAGKVMSFHVDHGLLCHRLGRLDSARRHLEAAMLIADAARDEPSRVSILGNLSLVLVASGRVREALARRREALALCDRIEGSISTHSTILTNLGLSLVQRGEYAEALEAIDRAERGLAQTAGPATAYPQAFRATCWWHLGQTARARRVVMEVLARTEAPPQPRGRVLLLAHALARAGGTQIEGVQPLGDAQALAEQGRDVNLSMAVRLARALDAMPAEGLALLADVTRQAAERGMLGHVLESHLCAARIATAFDPQLALHHARAALALAQDVDLVFSYRGEFWLHISQALLAAGQPEDALHVVAEGAEWVRRTARLHVPETFRDSFLRRNPANVQLLGLARQLGRGAA